MLYFAYSWYSTFTVHVSNLVRFEFLLFNQSHFARNAQNVFSSISARMNASHHGLSHSLKFPGAFAKWFDRHHECVGVVSFPFQLKLNMLGFLSVHADKNLKDWLRLNVGAVPRKMFAGVYWYEQLSLSWCGETTGDVYPSILDTLYMIVSDGRYHTETSTIWLRFIGQFITFGSGFVD